MKNKVLWCVIIVGVITASLTLWHYQVLQRLIAAGSGGDSNGAPGERIDDVREAERIVRLDEAMMKEFDIETGAAEPGKLQVHIALSGEVAFNSDRLAHIAPRVPGVVREVRKNLGDGVLAGEVMAVIESRELADAKAAYLASGERLTLAEANFAREEGLWQKKITAEKEYLQSRQVLAEARIELRSARQKLHALGFSEEHLKQLAGQTDQSLTRYEITAPLAGTVVEKHIVLGEVLKESSDPFVIADLTTVWVDLKAHQQDFGHVRPGQTVVVSGGPDLQTEGVISLVSGTMSQATRTALVRTVIPNADGCWMPGLYVTGRVKVDDVDAPVVISKDALVRLDGRSCVFVQTGGGFAPQAVSVGRSNDSHVEVTSGLIAGQRYVTRGAFTLKSELNKPSEE